MISGIFVSSIISHLGNYEGTMAFMTKAGMPFAGALLGISLLMRIVGSVSLIAGCRISTGAWILIVFLIPTTFIFHTDFSQHAEVIAFFDNVGLLGGLLVLASTGAGAYSLDTLWAGSASRSQKNSTDALVLASR
jgi:putative oxidoreductase